MKTIKNIILICCFFLTLTGCDEGFEELNTNPNAITNLDPALLFANAQRATFPGFWEGESTIVQHFVNAYDLGATSGHNFNQDNDNFNIPRWNDSYVGPFEDGNASIKLLVQGIALTTGDPSQSNLRNMMRIWKAHVFMGMVDTYADVPYFEAGKAYLEGIYSPVYDDDAVIYDDLYNELKSAEAALSPSGDDVPEDLIYGGDVAKWKKLANSLLLRLGMRYSKINPAKAEDIVSEAFNAGVMQTNDDDAYISYTQIYNNPMNGIATNNPYFYYLAEPLVNELKATNDPRAPFIAAKYEDPNVIQGPDSEADLTLSNQFGFPVGYNAVTVQDKADYRGTNGTGLNYSQPNYDAIANALAPIFHVTNSQTKLLLAEAAFRGWISGDPQQYYEEGIRASMAQWSLYPGSLPPITNEQINDYIEDEVSYNAANALELINTQYWVSNINNGMEAWANFRRTGLPALSPNTFNNNLNGGFVRRMPYPNVEAAENEANYMAASAAIGGDLLTSRVFWDIP